MKIAVIGLGFMGATHLHAWRAVAGAQLQAVVSGDERKLTGDLCGISGNLGAPGEHMDFSGIARYRSVAECLADANVEAVDICLPTDLHADVAIAAVRAGKHVLVEKPIALDADSADRMIAEARAARRILMCGQILRFMSNYRQAADMLPRLGAVRSAMFTRRCGAPAWNRWMGDAARSGGAVFDLLIHDVDYCISLFGKPEAVSARGFRDEALRIDWMRAELYYANSGPVTIDGGWFAPSEYPFRAEFTIMAEQGTLEYRSGQGPVTCIGNALNPPGHAQDAPDAFENQLAYFIECAAAGHQPNLCPPEDSADAVRVMTLLLESRKREGKRVLCSK